MKYLKNIVNNIISRLLILSVPIFLILSCSSPKTLNIALSKGIGSEGYLRYCQWLNSSNHKVNCINLYNIPYEEALNLLKESSGLVLTGGPDVHPDRYGRIEDTSRCEIDPIRDTLEFMLIEKALEMKIPIFAICRGEQILNVALGGSLIVDIPEDYPNAITHRCPKSDTCFHYVRILKDSKLYKITGVDAGIVNTNHHQAVARLAEPFKAVAFSEDNIIEAYEWIDPSNRSYLIAVQWHPERLDKSNPLSINLLNEFLKKVVEYERNRKVAQK